MNNPDWITDIPSFLKIIGEDDNAMMYRGQSRIWPLLPSIARYHSKLEGYEDWSVFQDSLLKEFAKFGAPHVGHSDADELEWLIHAQHHGLPTRLLDFSLNPLKALFFAVSDHREDTHEGVFIGFSPKAWIEDFVRNTALSNDELVAYLPRQVNARLIAQESCFVAFPLPKHKKPLEALGKSKEHHKSISRFTMYSIPAKAKRKLRLELKKLGVTHRSLFPDLGGVAAGIVSDLNET
jgi:hypothetical protein